MKLTITSLFASSIVIGEPGQLIIKLPTKETVWKEVTDVQLRQITPALDKLKNAGWLSYSTSEMTAAPVILKEELTVTALPIAPVAPPPVAPPVEPEEIPAPVEVVAETTPEGEPVAAPVPPPAPPAEVVTPAPKQSFFVKNRGK